MTTLIWCSEFYCSIIRERCSISNENRNTKMYSREVQVRVLKQSPSWLFWGKKRHDWAIQGSSNAGPAVFVLPPGLINRPVVPNSVLYCRSMITEHEQNKTLTLFQSFPLSLTEKTLLTYRECCSVSPCWNPVISCILLLKACAALAHRAN